MLLIFPKLAVRTVPLKGTTLRGAPGRAEVPAADRARGRGRARVDRESLKGSKACGAGLIRRPRAACEMLPGDGIHLKKLIKSVELKN